LSVAADQERETLVGVVSTTLKPPGVDGA